MPVNILMPALSPTMDKGNLLRWLKREGDKVKPGDVLAEIETDKATMEFEAADEGVLAKIVVPEGTNDVPVNDVIAVLAGEGEDQAAIAARGIEAPPRAASQAEKEPQPQQHAAPRLTAAAPEREPGAARPNGQSRQRIFASPLARRLAKDAQLDLANLRASAGL